ncbi:MAG: hypothetical protein FWE53_03745 [Firmicutes bacterium]|nr:hypothetical protein [Bacillota bacterium]
MMKNSEKDYKEVKLLKRKRSKFIYALAFVSAALALVVSSSFIMPHVINVSSVFGISLIKLRIHWESFYAVTLEEFINEQDAISYAKSVRLRGAAGYVWNGDYYRIIAAVYDEMDDANRVKERLLVENFRAEVYTIAAPVKTISGLNNLERRSISTIYDFFLKTYKKLYELSYKLDISKTNAKDAAIEIGKLKQMAEDTYAGMHTSTNKHMRLSRMQMENLIESLSYLTLTRVYEGSGFPYTSEIKYAYVRVLADYAEFNNL